MSFYDEYGDMIELNDFYSAIETTLKNFRISSQSKILEKGSKKNPRLPREYVEGNDDLTELITDDKLPF